MTVSIKFEVAIISYNFQNTEKTQVFGKITQGNIWN
jgi:hypothetical protein